MNLYFAYGSNMWVEQMRERCPDHRLLGGAILLGYRWIISSRGYATILEAPNAAVEGMLFEVSDTDLSKLDKKEGRSYYRKKVNISWEGKETPAYTYIDSVTDEGNPIDEYAERINSGIRDATLSEPYIENTIRKYVPR